MHTEEEAKAALQWLREQLQGDRRLRNSSAGYSTRDSGVTRCWHVHAFLADMPEARATLTAEGKLFSHASNGIEILWDDYNPIYM